MSSPEANTEAILPISGTSILAISRPRAETAVKASSNRSTPAQTKAAYSPRECPIVPSGSYPMLWRSRINATSAVSIAGCVISVCFNASRSSPKTTCVNEWPNNGVITRSASSNVSRTTVQSESMRSFSIPRYCDPCPGNKKANLPGVPSPKNTPRFLKAATNGAGEPLAMACSANSTRSFCSVSVPHTDRRTGDATAAPRSTPPARSVESWSEIADMDWAPTTATALMGSNPLRLGSRRGSCSVPTRCPG